MRTSEMSLERPHAGARAASRSCARRTRAIPHRPAGPTTRIKQCRSSSGGTTEAPNVDSADRHHHDRSLDYRAIGADLDDRRVAAVGLDDGVSVMSFDDWGDYLLNYIDNLIGLWINDDHLTAHHKEQVGLDSRYLGGHIRRHRMERDRF
jgi:hypothetical protein